MILVNALRESEEILVLGKCAENTYMMEFEFPLSPGYASRLWTVEWSVTHRVAD